MADARTLMKLPNEAMGAFNKRLTLACEQAQVTEAVLHVVDGEPMVTLFSEMVEATEEDVAEAKDAGDTLALGELIPEELPVVIQVCMVSAVTDEAAAKTQERLEKVFGRADGGVTKFLKDSGPSITGTRHFVGVVSLVDDDEDDAEGDEQMEQTLRASP